ncbi:MAG: hypothetical protein M0R18_01685 [Deltaproteobacteria bacterium]|nr:hypothetical protein [Deltaproteobacteria bacterium]
MNLTAWSENRASQRKWWFTDKNGNLLHNKDEGLTDGEALQWLLEENTKGMERIREKLKKFDEN